MAVFENYERRIEGIEKVMSQYGIGSLDEARKICTDKGFDPYEITKGVQTICFEDAAWAYVLGAAIAIKKGATDAKDAARAIGEGLQAFCIPGSVADDRKVGIGHGNLASMLLDEETECFAFLAGHESFAAAEGANRELREQSQNETASGYSERSRKGCREDYLQNQRFHLRENRIRLFHRGTENCRGGSLFRRRPGEGEMLRCI